MYHVDAARMYAVDLAKINGIGMQSGESFDVVSPCDGVVTTAGERVVIRCKDADVWLERLQRVSVRAGGAVRAGQPIGRVATILHVHAERGGNGVPARFDGRWLVRNDLVRR
jgi:septal ring factor EnvC (AmiA/AmiB activator)